MAVDFGSVVRRYYGARILLLTNIGAMWIPNVDNIYTSILVEVV